MIGDERPSHLPKVRVCSGHSSRSKRRSASRMRNSRFCIRCRRSSVLNVSFRSASRDAASLCWRLARRSSNLTNSAVRATAFRTRNRPRRAASISAFMAASCESSDAIAASSSAIRSNARRSSSSSRRTSCSLLSRILSNSWQRASNSRSFKLALAIRVPRRQSCSGTCHTLQETGENGCAASNDLS